jgi:predicted aconitase
MQMNDFAAWMEIMGYNGKQVSEAARLIGIKTGQTAGLTYRGTRELSLTERLAMSAVRAGLPPWTPELDVDADAMRGLVKFIDHAAGASRPAKSASGK